MPTYIRPGRVTITDDAPGPLAAVVGLAAAAVVVSSAAAVIADVLDAILITLAVLAVAGTGALVLLLRRTRGHAGLYAPVRPPVPRATRSPLLGAAAPAAAIVTRQVLPAVVLSSNDSEPGARDCRDHAAVAGVRFACTDPGCPLHGPYDADQEAAILDGPPAGA